jgi:hypothetical protein
MAWEDPLLVASGAKVATGNSGVQNSSKALNQVIALDVSAVTGTTPNLTVTVEWSMDGTNFGAASTPDGFTAITTAGNVRQSFTTKGPFFRLVWTITGTTPSFTLNAYRYGTGG